MINLVLYILILLALFKFLFPLVGKQLEKRDAANDRPYTPYHRKPLYWGLVLLIVIVYTIIFPTYIKPQPSQKKLQQIENQRALEAERTDRALLEEQNRTQEREQMLDEKERNNRKKWKDEYDLQSGPRG